MESRENIEDTAGAVAPEATGSALRWECVGHNPTRWSLGTLEDGRLGAIRAHITRRADGKWHWRTVSPDGVGVEPSR